MSYPKISAVVASQLMVASSSVKGNIPMAMVVLSPRGKTTPEVFSKDKVLVKEYGTPVLAHGKSLLYADTLLKHATDNLTVVRAVSGTSKYGGSLVRAKKGEENLTDLAKEIVIEPTVQPIGGLTQSELDTYRFPVYPRERAYGKVNQMYFAVTHDKLSESVYVTKEGMFEPGTQFALSTESTEPAANAQLYTLKDVDNTPVEKAISKVSVLINTKPSTTVNGAIYIVDSKSNKIRLGNIPTINKMLDVGKTQELLMMTSDFLYNGDTYNVVDETDAVLATVTVQGKVSHTEKVYELEFENRPDGNFYAQTFYEVTASDFEHRDSFAFISHGQGADNKNISVGTEDSKATEEAFDLVVYYKGAEVERHTVSMNSEVDGNNNQLEIETVVKANSRYGFVKKNVNMTDEDGKIMRPLISDSVRWQKKEEPHYLDKSVETAEDILKGDEELKVSDISKMGVGTRFVYEFPDGTRTSEYKVLVSDADKSVVFLDRPLEGKKDTIVKGTELMIFDSSYQDAENDIYDGNKKFAVQTIQNMTYPTAKGTYKEVGGMLGYVWDGGANRLGGATDGDPIKIPEIINALSKIADKEKYPYFFLADGGITDPSYKRAMIQLCQGRNSIAFTSARLASDRAADFVGATKQDFIDIGVTSEYFTFSQDWFYMSNLYTLEEMIPMPPSLSDLLVQAGAVSKDGFWTAAAGWRKGQYFCDGLVNPKEEGDRIALYNVGVNTTKVKAFKGTAKWSDLTGLNQARPLQYLSIMKLAVYTVHNLTDYLEDIHFEDYDENQIQDVTDAINEFLVDVISAGGMYDAQVVIGELVNDRKISTRVLPIYVAITGKQSIQGINFGLEVQQGTKTTVNLVTANKLTA